MTPPVQQYAAHPAAALSADAAALDARNAMHPPESPEQFCAQWQLDADTLQQLHKLYSLSTEAYMKVVTHSLSGSRNPCAVVTKRCVQARNELMQSGLYGAN